ncbi:hypothetical protein DIURU_005610 [Diutina rugosa]|uniref:Uncharacterized protein n=1 Tax=Diutina rugosa TaxID=5481 RepID=A0A642UJD9_DIURU|nr:uncharacterized protein DIURU_005610 [Diutina rugosa]KAA8896598.1 hypothetical protein DIURU_005610 [Diutina rugosa]
MNGPKHSNASSAKRSASPVGRGRNSKPVATGAAPRPPSPTNNHHLHQRTVPRPRVLSPQPQRHEAKHGHGTSPSAPPPVAARSPSPSPLRQLDPTDSPVYQPRSSPVLRDFRSPTPEQFEEMVTQMPPDDQMELFTILQKHKMERDNFAGSTMPSFSYLEMFIYSFLLLAIVLLMAGSLVSVAVAVFYSVAFVVRKVPPSWVVQKITDTTQGMKQVVVSPI